MSIRDISRERTEGVWLAGSSFGVRAGQRSKGRNAEGVTHGLAGGHKAIVGHEGREGLEPGIRHQKAGVLRVASPVRILRRPSPCGSVSVVVDAGRRGVGSQQTFLDLQA